MSIFNQFLSFPEWREASANLEEAIKNNKKKQEYFIRSTEDCFTEFVRKQPEQINDILFKINEKYGLVKQCNESDFSAQNKLYDDISKLKPTYDDIVAKKKNHEKIKSNFEKSKSVADKAEQRLTAARAKGSGSPDLRKAEEAFETATRQKQIDTANYEESESKMVIEVKEYKIRLFQQLLQSISNFASNCSQNSSTLTQIGNEIHQLGESIPNPEDQSVVKLKTRLQTLRAEPIDS